MLFCPDRGGGSGVSELPKVGEEEEEARAPTLGHVVYQGEMVRRQPESECPELLDGKHRP